MRVETLCGDFINAVINGGYQGLMLVLLVAGLLRLPGRTNATTRHAVWFASLILVVFLIPAHYWLNLLVAGGYSFNETPDAMPAGVLGPPSLPSPERTLPENPVETGLSRALGEPEPGGGLAPDDFDSRSYGSMDVGLAPPDAARLPADAAGVGDSPPAASAEGLARNLERTLPWLANRFVRPVSWMVQSRFAFPIVAAGLSLWLLVATARLVTLTWRLAQLRKLVAHSTTPGPELGSLFDRLLASSPVRRRVQLRISGHQRGPLVMGFFRPVILLPADMSAGADLLETEHVLRHELAHVQRLDDWANLVQQLVQALLFFHPAVWWVGRRLSLEREIACDDQVLQHAPGRRSYALILANVARRMNQTAPMLAQGVFNSNSQLQQRISMILSTRRNSSPVLAKGRLAWLLSATALVAGFAVYSGPRLVLAQTPGGISPARPVAASAAPVAATPLSPPVLTLAEAGPPETPPAGVEPGPKFKPEPPVPPEVAPPTAPDGPTIDLDEAPAAPPARHVARAKAAAGPRPPRVPDEPSAPDGSIEERLRRLERMVESLVAQQKGRGPRASFYLKDGGDQELKMGKMQSEELEKLKESMDRQAERAAQQAKRAAEQVKRATKDYEARIDEEQLGPGQIKEALQKQLDALRKARESLGQEMQRLDRQIEKLETEQQRTKHGQQRGDADLPPAGEFPGDKLQAEAAPTPEPAP